MASASNSEPDLLVTAAFFTDSIDAKGLDMVRKDPTLLATAAAQMPGAIPGVINFQRSMGLFKAAEILPVRYNKVRKALEDMQGKKGLFLGGWTAPIEIDREQDIKWYDAGGKLVDITTEVILTILAGRGTLDGFHLLTMPAEIESQHKTIVYTVDARLAIVKQQQAGFVAFF